MAKLTTLNIPYLKLKTSHAFHSVMQEEILNEFKKELDQIVFEKPKIPIISNLTGQILRDEITSSNYWINHLRQTVKFSDSVNTLLIQNKQFVFIEIGPGNQLTNLIRQHKYVQKPVLINIVRPRKDNLTEMFYLTDSLCQLWEQGLKIDWKSYSKYEKRRRISLPTYSFEPIEYISETDLVDLDGFSKENLMSIFTKKDNSDFESKSLITLERPEALSHYIEPTSDSEKKIAYIFENFFQIEKIGVNDNFFELGGNSLNAMIILRKIKDEFKINLPLQEFLEKETIQKLSIHIDEILELLKNENDSQKKNIRI